MFVFIIVSLLSVDLIIGQEYIVLRTTGTSVPTSNEPIISNSDQSYTTIIECWPVIIYEQPLKTTFQSQDTSHIADRNPPQPTNRNQDRKLPRLFLYRLIVAAMNHNATHGNNRPINIKKSTSLQQKRVNNDKVVFKNKEVNQLETNTVVSLNSTSVTFPEETTVESTTEIAKPNKNSDSKTKSNDTSLNVSLEDRSSFVGDNCPTGYAKVNGKCVQIVE